MRRSPRRPLILKRRKLPFQQSDPSSAERPNEPSAASTDAPKPSVSHRFPDGIRILDHPCMSDTQVVVIPKTANLKSVIGALTARGKECGAQGPNKFILLSGSGEHEGGSLPGQDGVSAGPTDGQPSGPDDGQEPSEAKSFVGIKRLKQEQDCAPLNDSLTNITWLGRISPFEPESAKESDGKENQDPAPPDSQAPKALAEEEEEEEVAAKDPVAERPPYSYMAMIQFAINSRKNRRMTLKEIYTWIEDHFPYFREVAKPGWKNSIRHNLSLHDMFIRETSPDGKISFWTIRPEANRCLTLDQVYKPGCDPAATPVPVPMILLPQQQKRILPEAGRPAAGSEKKMKPLLPRTSSYLVPIQLPVTPSLYLPASSARPPPSRAQQRKNISRSFRRVRIAPKLTDSAKVVDIKEEVKEEPVTAPVQSRTPKCLSGSRGSSSRRKQHLVRSAHEEPVLLCPDSTFLDSGVVCDVSQDGPDAEADEPRSAELAFKTPIKSVLHLTSSTPRKPPSSVPPEPWKVTPLGKGGPSVPDFSPIRTPGGPAVTPQHDYANFSFGGTPFKDWSLFSSPLEPAASAPPAPPVHLSSPRRSPRSSCSRELLGAGAATPTRRPITEGLVLDTMNDSLSKILVDISFPGLDDEELGMSNISWSEILPQLKAD